jgi:hypothetical protein
MHRLSNDISIHSSFLWDGLFRGYICKAKFFYTQKTSKIGLWPLKKGTGPQGGLVPFAKPRFSRKKTRLCAKF